MSIAVAALTVSLTIIALSGVRAESLTPATDAALSGGDPSATIVCFGDSITGVYYHTGGIRAYPEMLQLALSRQYPSAKVKVINAGISGNTTVQALARIERDVLAHKPQLVTVMFGMNDVTGVPPETYRQNLLEIAARCRGIGAEVMLCTPNSIYDEDPRRPMAKLAEYSGIVRAVAAEQGLPVVDFFAEYERIRKTDMRRWMLLMSETIHPSMHGHKLFAEMLAKAISGREISLADVSSVPPFIPRTAALIKAGSPVKVVAMPPAASLIAPALASLDARAQVNVIEWPLGDGSLASMENWGRGVRGLNPDLVLIAVPASATSSSEEQFIRSYSWIVNWSLSFGKREWDCVAVLPSVFKPELTEAEGAAEAFALDVIRGNDIPWISRAEGDQRDGFEILKSWLQANY
ncbi:MAG: hypothetical protein HPY44_09130 [Armatimonadetes bacterium]|nr:hypothetical protein [Armatimonadota bacterium]